MRGYCTSMCLFLDEMALALPIASHQYNVCAGGICQPDNDR